MDTVDTAILAKLKSPQNMPFLLQTDGFHERIKFWMFQTNWKGIFNISKNPKINKKNGHAGYVWIQRFRPKLKSPQNMPFLLQTACFHERIKFLMFQTNWKGIFDISKNPKINQKMEVRNSRFWPNWKVPKHAG